MNTVNKVETLQELQDKYIFLDFDGVLHTLSDAYNNHEFSHLNRLDLFVKNAIEKNPIRINIVVSSNWRLKHSVDELKDFLRHDICGYTNNIAHLLDQGLVKIDVTGREIYSKTQFLPSVKSYDSENNRYLEITNYIQEHHIQFGDYVVLDDNDSLFFIVHEDKNAKVKLHNGTYGYDNIVQPLISDKLGDIENKVNESDVFSSLSKEQQEFNKSYVSTYKSWLRDGYLDRNNIIEMNKILGLKF